MELSIIEILGLLLIEITSLAAFRSGSIAVILLLLLGSGSCFTINAFSDLIERLRQSFGFFFNEVDIVTSQSIREFFLGSLNSFFFRILNITVKGSLPVMT